MDPGVGLVIGLGHLGNQVSKLVLGLEIVLVHLDELGLDLGKLVLFLVHHLV